MAKAKKCKVCKSEFTPNKPLQIVCGLKCAIAYANEKLSQKKAKESKIRQSKRREDLKSLTDYKSEAKSMFQLFIRLRDKDKPCISCGTLETKLWDGGHYKKAELYYGVTFNENNVHKQCRKCNRFLGGNELNYRKGLIDRYGIEYVESIEILADETRQKKWTKEELIEIKNEYFQKVKQLKGCI